MSGANIDKILLTSKKNSTKLTKMRIIKSIHYVFGGQIKKNSFSLFTPNL